MSLIDKIRGWLYPSENDEIIPHKEKESAPESLLVDISSCEQPGTKASLTVMTVADGHGRIMERDLEKLFSESERPDVVFLLGDNFDSDINSLFCLLPKGIPVYGIAGNHDAVNILSNYKYVTDLHCKTDELSQGIIIGGMAGSIRYKPDPYYTMFSNEEASALMRDLPYCDILITHDKPCFSIPETITSHSGLVGIGDYILKHKPHLVLHGHLHEPYIKRLGATIIRCCYGAEIFHVSF